jgi:hypothetical protein
MTRLQAIFLHVSVAIVAATGVVFAWMKYGMKSDDPFAVANHPWQPYLLDLHVVFAPILVFALGWIFQGHILAKASSSSPRKKSGISGMLLFAPMILSGYILQVVTNEGARHWSAVAHWITSSLFVLAYLIHQLTRPSGVDEPNGNGGKI